jgi:ABC-type branched-subunit amino acid transport system permease subunit
MVITRTFTIITLLTLLMFATIYNNTKQAKKGGRGIALPILNPSTRRRVGSWYDALLLYFPKEPWYPLDRWRGGPGGQ